ncbi:MAG: hypothetical protein IJU75_07200 [Clostridia bacterium]|nr:hypothetical protein [Clostridia bacterium]
MKKLLTAVLSSVLFVVSYIVCAAGGPPRFDVEGGTGRLGGDVTLRAEQDGATGAVWLMTEGDALVPAGGEAASVPSGGALVSTLTLKKVSQGDVTRDYYCVFFAPDGCSVSNPARIVCLPEIREDSAPGVGGEFDSGPASDHVGKQRLSCAWLAVSDEGTPDGGYLSGTGWYRVTPDGEYRMIAEGGREIPCGGALALPGLTREDSGATYAYRVVNRAGTSELILSVTLEGTDSAVSKYVGRVSLVPTPSGEIVSGEPDKYTVTGWSEDGGEYAIFVKAEGDYKFRSDSRQISGRLGMIPLVSDKTPGIAAAELVLRGKEEVKGTPAVSVTSTVLTPENGSAETGAPSAAQVFGLPSGASLTGGVLTAPHGGFSFAAVDGNEIKCFTVSENVPAGEPPVFVTERLDGGNVGEGYSFRVTFLPSDALISEVGDTLSSLGLTLGPDGVISGVPTLPGNREITLSLMSGGAETRKTFVLAISEKKESYKITFIKNGGSGEMPEITVGAEPGLYTVPGCGFGPPSGAKAFSHWSSAAGDLFPGEVITVTSDLKLSAVWTAAEHVHSFRATPSGDVHVFSCSCGESYTAAHTGGTADCRNRAKCEVCGAAYGSKAPHSYKNGVCEVCGAKEPKTPGTGPAPSVTSPGGETTDPEPVSGAATGENTPPVYETDDTGTVTDKSSSPGETTGPVIVATRRPPDLVVIIILLLLVVACLSAGIVSLADAKRKR